MFTSYPLLKTEKVIMDFSFFIFAHKNAYKITKKIPMIAIIKLMGPELELILES
jgi:hypothetical protein